MCDGARLVLCVRDLRRGESRRRLRLMIISDGEGERMEFNDAGLMVLQLVEVRHTFRRQRGQNHGPFRRRTDVHPPFGTVLLVASGMATNTWLPAGPLSGQ